MDNFNNKDIYSDNDWQNVSTPTVKPLKSDCEDDTEELLVKESKNRRSKAPVLTFQLVVVMCVLLFLFILRFLNVPAFDRVMDWYKLEISKSVIFSGDFENFDFTSIFATSDEA